jgi:hypothetical protein
MIARFEVSQIRFDGGVRWLGAVETIEKAHDRVKQSSRQDSKINHFINDIKDRRSSRLPGSTDRPHSSLSPVTDSGVIPISGATKNSSILNKENAR